MAAIFTANSTEIAHRRSEVIEVFPKVLNKTLLRQDCADDCSCHGPDYAHIEQLNHELLRKVESVLEEVDAEKLVCVYQFSTEMDQAEAIRRLSDVLETQGFSRFEIDEQGMQMLELVTPVIVVDGKLRSFATYPTREKLKEAILA